jgi:hypothetical protein
MNCEPFIAALVEQKKEERRVWGHGPKGLVCSRENAVMAEHIEDEDDVDEDGTDGDDDEGGTQQCPYCDAENCDSHRLGEFDADRAEGNFGIGLVGGPLYGVDAIGEVLNLTRLAWVHSVRTSGKPVPPLWVAGDTDLKDYFEGLGDGDINVDDYESDGDAADDLDANDSSSGARDFLESVVNKCGWSGGSTRREHDVPLYSTSYETWWDPEPEEIVSRLKTKLNELIGAARNGNAAK